ncbi:MAG: hypothetical protein AAB368_12830 [bacterium]
MHTWILALRIVHVGLGTFWAGTVFFSSLILFPRLKRLGPGIENPVMRSLMAVASPVMAASSVLVLVTGVALVHLMGAFGSLLTTPWGQAISVGFAATALAIVVGASVLAPAGMRLDRILSGLGGRDPGPEETRTLRALADRVEFFDRINCALVLIATGAMAVARLL